MTFTTIVYLKELNDHFLSAVDSVERQSYPSAETLVLDQNSANLTQGMLELKDCDNYFSYERSNFYNSLNELIKSTCSDFIAFLNARDFWLDDHLKISLEFIESNPNCGWVVSNCIATDKYLRSLDGNQGFTRLFPLFELTGISPEELFEIRPGENVRAGDFSHSVNFGTWIELSGLVIRKDIFENLGGFEGPENLSTECEFYKKLIFSSHGVVNLSPTYLHRT